MYKEIIEKLESLREEKFAEWLRPLLSIPKDSEEILLGIRTPILRKLATQYKSINIELIKELLESKYHEAKSLAIFIMLKKVKTEPKLICQTYLENLEHINNWDLIDYSAPHIVAPYTDKKTLRNLADSDYMWANRVAIVSTIYFIKRGDFSLTIEFANKFLSHPHHLIHKATGWMLREIGKQDVNILIEFLEKYSDKMPSVMRSYAKERLR